MQKYPNRPTKMLIFCAVASMTIIGCRAEPVGLSVSFVRGRIAESSTQEVQQKLIDRHYPEADRVLGRRMDVLRDARTKKIYMRYPVSRTLNLEDFYIVGVSDTKAVTDVHRWTEWSDGFADTFKLVSLRSKVIDQPIARAEAGANLPHPLFTFQSSRSPNRMYVYNATGIMHKRQRLLILTTNRSGVCQKAAYYGVAGSMNSR